ncbi:MAG: acyltransferase [Pseudomonadota bacterium]
MPGMIGYGLRFVWAKRLAKSVGRSVKIGRGTMVRNWNGLELADYSGLNEMCFVDAIGGIKLGRDSTVGHMSSILSFEHRYDDVTLSMRDQGLVYKPLVIGDDVIIMAGVRVLAGKTIGDRVIVAANSVVTKDLPSNGIYGGVPAKLLSQLPTPQYAARENQQ